DLPERHVVARMGGRGMSDAEFARFVASRSRFSPLGLGARLPLVQPDDDPAAAGNHSCAPNARVVDRVTVVATRAIAAGEEITTDYALVTDDPGWSMRCACGAAQCRGTVRAVGSAW